MSKSFIDAGHGGYDPGACGNGKQEKDITLAVSLEVDRHLKRHGVNNYMSRTSDVCPTLTDRTNIANYYDVDCSASIHADSSANKEARGFTIYTYGTGNNEIKLANCISNRLVEAKLYSINRGIKQANFHMVRETKMAAVLIEMAFISNFADSELLANNISGYAVAIAKGILDYLGISWLEENNHPYGTRNVIVSGNVTCTSNSTIDIQNAVYEALKGTQDIIIKMV